MTTTFKTQNIAATLTTAVLIIALFAANVNASTFDGDKMKKSESFSVNTIINFVKQIFSEPVVNATKVTEPTIDHKQLLTALAIQNDETTELELWMTNNSTWDTSTLSSDELSVENWMYAAWNEQINDNVEVEAWMYDTNYWTNSISNEDSEVSQQIEYWMTDTNSWNEQASDTEEAMEIENWMLDGNIWMNDSEEKEEVLNVEAWMVDSNNWNQEASDNQTELALPVENWMIDSNAWTTENIDNEETIEVETWMSDSTYWK